MTAKNVFITAWSIYRGMVGCALGAGQPDWIGECLGGPGRCGRPYRLARFGGRGEISQRRAGNLACVAAGFFSQVPWRSYNKKIARWQAGTTLHCQHDRAATLGPCALLRVRACSA